LLLIQPAIHQTAQKSLRAELEVMMQTDQKGRKELILATKEYGPYSPEVQKLWDKQSAIDQKNTQRLLELVERHGWPKRSVVGEGAAEAAFLVLQHADLETQKRYLPVFIKAVEGGEAKLSDLALLEDRVLVGEGKKQLYGTQLRTRKGVEGMEIPPIEDEAHIDERRATMGLGPLAGYLKAFGIDYRKPITPAPNPSPQPDR
jgi:hypothetical protein